MGFFPIDEQTCRYLPATARSQEQVDNFRAYFEAQGMFGRPRAGDIDYSTLLELDLDSVRPSVAGPKRPQDRIELPELKDRFHELLLKPFSENGYNLPAGAVNERFVLRTGMNGLTAALEGGGEQATETVPQVAAPLTS